MHIVLLTFVLYLSIAVETETYFFTGKRRRREKVNITTATGIGKNITNKPVDFEAHHLYCEHFRMKNKNIGVKRKTCLTDESRV